MRGSLRIAKPAQTTQGLWVVRGKLNGKPIRFDTIGALGPWCISPNGSSARAALEGGQGISELPHAVQAELWERAREVERYHIRAALMAADRAGISDEAREKLRRTLSANNGRALPWEIVQVTGARIERVGSRKVKRLTTRRIRCGSSLIRACAAYRQLVAQNKHTTLRRAR